LDRKQELIEAMIQEIGLRESYLTNKHIHSIYFGGGTPSLINKKELTTLLETIHQLFIVDDSAEITLEANPDDLSLEKLKLLKAVGINRLSIGIQSFNDRVLKELNRAHDSQLSLACVKNAQHVGFDNISIDLIYSIPGQSRAEWAENISLALSLKPQHISSYSLTIEERTVFGNWYKKGKLAAVDEEEEASQLELLVAELSHAGFYQYEVSNFCLPGFESKHNSSYWHQQSYIGIGPSAHSYNGKSRQWNVTNNHKYIKSIQEGIIPETIEKLSREDFINEYLLTRLRTHWGCDIDYLKNTFADDLLQRKSVYIQQLIQSGLARIDNNHLKLNSKGLLLADKISSDLFV
jgi:oxygen-independent coproporphyrinogen III oxidase